MASASSEVTGLLRRWSAGDESARDRLIPLVYDRLRQKNVIPKKKLPYRTASGLLYDSGDFAGNMKRMIEASDWKGFAARKRESKDPFISD